MFATHKVATHVICSHQHDLRRIGFATHIMRSHSITSQRMHRALQRMRW